MEPPSIELMSPEVNRRIAVEILAHIMAAARVLRLELVYGGDANSRFGWRLLQLDCVSDDTELPDAPFPTGPLPPNGVRFGKAFVLPTPYSAEQREAEVARISNVCACTIAGDAIAGKAVRIGHIEFVGSVCGDKEVGYVFLHYNTTS